MDYISQAPLFKIKKAIRYTRLYGLKRTLVKISGQYHMKKSFARLPIVTSPLPGGGHIGIIGCGNYSFSNIAYFLNKNYGHVMRAAMDTDIHKAASLYGKFGLRYYTENAHKVIEDPEIDLVYIASNHETHAEYAIKALNAGKSVHIEKPHIVREEQLVRLCLAMKESVGKVNLGFNRPHSRIGRTIKHYLDLQDGPAMYNWFIAGHQIEPDHWYFREEEGGRILGNLCHWTDFVLQMVEPQYRYPLTINPTKAKKSDCDIAVTYTFGDGSIAAITFSAKGHTFEGVRERFAAHRGNTLLSMDDFKTLTVEVIDKKRSISPLFRDHGHERNIMRSYEMVRPKKEHSSDCCSIEYVWETGNLFLKTKESLETGQPIRLTGYPGNLS